MSVLMTFVGMIDVYNTFRGVINFVKTPIGMFTTFLLAAFLVVSICVDTVKENAKKANKV